MDYEGIIEGKYRVTGKWGNKGRTMRETMRAKGQ